MVNSLFHSPYVEYAEMLLLLLMMMMMIERLDVMVLDIMDV